MTTRPEKLVDGISVPLSDEEFAEWQHAVTNPPAPPVPGAISRFQAKAALQQAGLLEEVEAAITAADDLTKLAWSETQEFVRGSPTIVALGAALSLSETQIDDLFR